METPTEPEQEARRVETPACLDRGEEVVDRLLLPPLAANQFVAVSFEAKDVGRAVEPAEPARVAALLLHALHASELAERGRAGLVP